MTQESAPHARLSGSDGARRLVDAWAEGLSQSIESMADSKPEIRWEPAAHPGADKAAEEELWWEQPLQFVPGATVWVGTPRSAWEFAGGVTLKAAGLDTVELPEARNTWLEIVSQSLSAMARSASDHFGVSVVCEGGQERAPGPEVRDYASFFVTLSGTQMAALTLALSPALVEAASRSQAGPESTEPAAVQAPEPRSRTMDLLLDIELPVSISFGRIHLPMKDVLKLTTGSIVELDRDVSEPVDVLVNRCLIARGEVVVVEGNYGVRIQQIASRQDRLRSIP